MYQYSYNCLYQITCANCFGGYVVPGSIDDDLFEWSLIRTGTDNDFFEWSWIRTGTNVDVALAQIVLVGT